MTSEDKHDEDFNSRDLKSAKFKRQNLSQATLERKSTRIKTAASNPSQY